MINAKLRYKLPTWELCPLVAEKDNDCDMRLEFIDKSGIAVLMHSNFISGTQLPLAPPSYRNLGAQAPEAPNVNPSSQPFSQPV